jgi:hypothetical protein
VVVQRVCRKYMVSTHPAVLCVLPTTALCRNLVFSAHRSNTFATGLSLPPALRWSTAAPAGAHLGSRAGEFAIMKQTGHRSLATV